MDFFVILGEFFEEIFKNVWGIFGEFFGNSFGNSLGNSLGIVWWFTVRGFLFGNFLGILWEFFGIYLRILWNFFGNSLGISNFKCWHKVVNVTWIEAIFDLRRDKDRTNQILRSTLARSRLKIDDLMNIKSAFILELVTLIRPLTISSA